MTLADTRHARPIYARIRFTLLAAAMAIATVACGNTPAAQTAPASTPAPQSTDAGVPTAAGGGSAAACRDLKNLKSLDYAFGASFSIIKSLDASGKALTLQHLQAFVAEAPAELQSAVADLAAFWTAMIADPNSVTESDPRLTSATQKLNDWLAANCA
jgi:hypothetical protein